MTSLREFCQACHEAARRTGGRIVEFRIADSVTPNFHQGVLDYGGRRLSVVCTCDRTEPATAVAEPQAIDGTAVDAGPLTFVEAPELVAVLAEFPAFQVLTPADLAGPFDARTWPGYHPADLKYWAPADLGEVLFNYWGPTGVRARRHESALAVYLLRQAEVYSRFGARPIPMVIDGCG